MLDDRRHRLGACAVLLLAGLLPGISPARAENVYGTFQTQWQRLDEHALFMSGDSTLITRSRKQELWLRTLDVHHLDYIRPDLRLESNVRYADQSYPGLANVSRSPMGSLRLIHPRFQVLASHQPSSQTSSLSTQSGLNPNEVTSRKVTSHNRESMVTGHVSLPRWPSVDASWIHRRRDGAGSVADQNTSRNLRLSLDREHWSAYGGVNDQRLSSALPGSGRNTQQVWTAGGAYHYQPVPTASLHSQYDLSAVRGLASGVQRPSTVNHTGSISGDWRPGTHWLTTMSYQLRHVDFGTSANPPQTDHEGALIGRYQFTRRSSLLGGGGVRTVRNFMPEGGAVASLQKYLTALASLETRVRRKWTMTGGLSHTTNFDPNRAVYHVETLNGTSRGQLARGIQLDGSIQVSANSDSGSVASRYANAWTARIQGTPLRALQLGLALRSLRSGPGLLRPNAIAKGYVADVNWRPTPAFQILGQYGSNHAEPANASRNSTRSLSLRYQPSRQWQWYGSWTRSDQSVVSSTAGQLSSREVVTSRVQYEPSRRLAMTAGVTYNDPRRALETKRLDLALTWSFGR